ncbi:MAG: hypothetical protein SFZ23_14760 [Planctomycetota bacterium]|nr:hypothetical protein [Planctomycetota bacterium]
MALRSLRSLLASRRPAFAALALVGLLGAGFGCHSAPKHVASLDDASRGKPAAATYWKNLGVPEMPQGGRSRLGITEFSVEYVVSKRYGLFGSRPVAGVDEYSITGGITDLVGIGRDQLELEPQVMSELPGALHAQFARQLQDVGFEIIPLAQVAAAPAYQQIESFTPGAAYPVQFLNVVGSDTGRPKQIKVYPADGLKVVKGNGPRADEIKRSLLKELGADVLASVRLRVGVDSGFASVERESSVRLTWLDEAGNLKSGEIKAIKSLLSDAKVNADDSFALFQGDVNTVDPALYREQLMAAFKPYASLAVQTLQGTQTSEVASKPASSPQRAH